MSSMHSLRSKTAHANPGYLTPKFGPN
jgi:hypothetical protein